MQHAKLLSIVLLAFAPSAFAGCFSKGESWVNPIKGVEAADKACRERLAGNYNGKEVRTFCHDDGGRHYDYTVERRVDTDGFLSQDHCKLDLGLEATGCQHGGRSEKGDWVFISDPNSGACPP